MVAFFAAEQPPIAINMRITVLFFAYLKELAKADQKTYDLAPSSTVEILGKLVAEGNQSMSELLARSRVAVNEEWAAWSRPLSDGDIVAFIPPVSGG